MNEPDTTSQELLAALRLVLDGYADLMLIAKDLLERAVAGGQLTQAEAGLYQKKFQDAEAGAECLQAVLLNPRTQGQAC